MAGNNLTGRGNERNPSDVREGDRVVMVVSPHGRDTCPSQIEGTVYDAPSESTREMAAENGWSGVLADFAVETDDGEKYRWNTDNGYIIGFHPGLGRRSDVARFRRFEEPTEE